MLKGRERINCSICNDIIGDFKYEAMPQWNISGFLCSRCYSKRISEHYIKQNPEEKKLK
jgi:hypothetical protein